MKHKNGELPANALLALFGVVLSACIILYSKIYIDDLRNTSDKVMEDTVEMACDFDEHDIAMYDGEEIRGSSVVNYIKKNLGDYTAEEEAPIYVKVVTEVSGTIYTNEYVNKEHIKDIRNISELMYYIKPTAQFTSKVNRSDNKVILGITFTQK